MKITAALLLFLIAFICFMIDLSGMHGNIMFRPNMKEDWIIWGIIIISSVSGLILLASNKKDN